MEVLGRKIAPPVPKVDLLPVPFDPCFSDNATTTGYNVTRRVRGFSEDENRSDPR